MPGMRSEEEIIKAFENLDRVPGSKQKRRESTPEADARRQRILDGPEGWDANSTTKVFQGKEVELFTVSSLALALDKEIVTIRLWERKGYIPIAPYRLRSKSLNGKKVNGNRVYTRELIEIAIEEFAKRGLLGAARVEWSQHHDLTEALVQRWKDALQ